MNTFEASFASALEFDHKPLRLVIMFPRLSSFVGTFLSRVVVPQHNIRSQWADFGEKEVVIEIAGRNRTGKQESGPSTYTLSTTDTKKWVKC